MSMKRLLGLGLFLILLVGCTPSHNQKVTENSIPVKDATQEHISHPHINGSNWTKLLSMSLPSTIQDFHLINTQIHSKNIFLFFTYRLSNKPFEGIAYVNQSGSMSTLENIDTAQVDQSSPYTLHQMSGSLSSEPKRNYIVTAGLINDKKIQQVQIIYPNNTAAIKVVGSTTHSYMDSQIGLNSIREIDYLGSDLKVLFRRK
ncbi:hypothetical protein LSG31_10640 [Fodinisporobacter ferrooxydans]|uniref:Uncharacterized protein n=1 Tax=Fodinisporobacter ferrooxydans TaxID=2901836 RepID=A0ABY4CQL6_9BACL|nr:hypothetical protein LSG31_10640 [Alicyclobacillaceae bacterium MYW30-H2]